MQSIDCVSCSALFRGPLKKVNGVLEVKDLPITNKIIVVFDSARLERGTLIQEITRISQKAGYRDKVIFQR